MPRQTHTEGTRISSAGSKFGQENLNRLHEDLKRQWPSARFYRERAAARAAKGASTAPAAPAQPIR
jgi:hypothetical protein